MLRWLKDRSDSKLPETDSRKSASADSNLHPPGRFRLEPLEPRVLLSADSIAVAIGYQTLLDAETKQHGDGTAVIAEDHNSGTDAGSGLGTESDGSAVADSPKISVAWSDSWMAGSPSDSEDDSESASVIDTETSLLQPLFSESEDGQAAQLEQAAVIVAAQQKSDLESSSALVDTTDEDQIVALSTVAELPRGPPADDYASSALVAQELMYNNELNLSDSPTHFSESC